jgi:ribosomal protein S6
MEQYQITILTKTEADKDAVKDIIGKVGGELTDERSLGQRALAYPIKKERVAYFTLLTFTMEPEQVLTLNKELLLSGHLLRHMITTAPKAPVRLPASPPAIKKSVASASKADAEPLPSTPAKTVKKTKAQLKAEAAAAKERQKRIEEELEKILKEA